MSTRVVELRLAASDLVPTKALIELLNRALAALLRASLIVECADVVPTVRTPDQPEVSLRTLGPRSVDQVPPRELDAAICSTDAWMQGRGVGHIQQAVLEQYHSGQVSLKAATHLNVCINRSIRL